MLHIIVLGLYHCLVCLQFEVILLVLLVISLPFSSQACFFMYQLFTIVFIVQLVNNINLLYLIHWLIVALFTNKAKLVKLSSNLLFLR